MAQVEALLADAAKAAESGNEAALAAAFEGGSSYPRRDLERFKEAEFWKLRPGRRIKRLGPDAFEVPLSPRKADASSTSEGPISLSTNLRLPVRVGSDRRLKIMPVDEARRLEEALASASADPAPTVELLMLPDEDSWLWGAGHHFASEFWVTTAGDQATFRIRFDPPLVGPSLRADVPPPQGAGWLGEMGVDLTLDADGDPATGTLESKVHQEAGGSWPALTPPGAAEFGIDRVLKVYGKKFDAGGGTWGDLSTPSCSVRRSRSARSAIGRSTRHQ